jgi:L-ascorbate metabolism protein UlaG (beta-lactamase superfamily)
LLLSAACAGPPGPTGPPGPPGKPGIEALLPLQPFPEVKVPVDITFLGHAAFELKSEGKVVLIDPWIEENPVCPIKLEEIEKADLVLVTHDHFDHVGDTIALAKATGATVVTMYETAAKLQELGLPKENVLFGGFGRNKGGALEIKGIEVVMTQAVHSGFPCGFVVRFPGGGAVYHAGDTAIFQDMVLLPRLYRFHVALLPIGGGFTMDSYEAAKSLRLLKPAVAIPMHYGSFPILEATADKFIALAKEEAPEVEVVVLKPGEAYTLKAGT